MAEKKTASKRGFPGGQAVLLVNDATLNNTNKIFTVPAGQEWDILSVYVDFSSTATVGTRWLSVVFRDPADAIIARVFATTSQTASLQIYHTFANGLALSAAGNNNKVGPLPSPLILPAGYDIRVLDDNAVDAAADDMTVRIFGRRR